MVRVAMLSAARGRMAMKRLARPALLAFAVAVLAAIGSPQPARAQEGVYLSDLLKTEPYRGAWNKMIASEPGLPPWIRDFALTGAGVNTPAHRVPVGYRAFSLATLCKPGDCGDNMLYVMFSPDGSESFAELVEASGKPRMLGKPNASVRAALNAAIAKK
jgi:Inhibitor of vertebrate lysozyme (Ivy)